MGRSLYEESADARAVFDEADEVLGFALSEIIFSGPESALNLTYNTQPAILTMSIAILRTLEHEGIQADVVTGHSLGTYGALVAAGSMDFSDAVKVVRRRGRLMQDAVEPGLGAMAAIIGLDAGAVSLACERASRLGVVAPANFNGPDQVVISGEREAVENAVQEAKGLGARRAVFLPVSGPFHSSLMAGVEAPLLDFLEGVVISRPRVPFVADTEARYLQDPLEIRRYLARQVASPVRFTEVLRLLSAEGVEVFVEVGPGQVLSGFTKRTIENSSVFSLDPCKGGKAALEFLREVL
ncbi:MAG TPA: ACP S-malonyltransferase [Firmicutes bacterium]|nr:ACP S-malonyltransferase [Bacillota bacterium]